MISYRLHHFLEILQVEDYEREIEENVERGKGKERAISKAQQEQPEQLVVWDNVQFHPVALVREWIKNHPHFVIVFLPAKSPF